MITMNGYENSNSTTKSRSVLTEVYTQKRGTCVTVVILGIIIGIFAFAYITFGNETTTDAQAINSTLKLVNIIFHHGQTNPRFTYPNDPYRNDSRWQIGLGELTKKGKQSMYNLGKYLRERYGGFLPELYYSSDVQVLSSNSDACLTSAAVLLAGLYPPHKYQIWNPHVLWQPIPVKGISREVDKMIDLTKDCWMLRKKLNDINKFTKRDDENLSLIYDYLTTNTGMEVNNLTTISELYELLNAQERNNLLLPEWTRSVYPNVLLNYTIKRLLLETESPSVIKLSSGVLLNKILSDMRDKYSNISNSRIFLYSANERTVVNLLRILSSEKYSTITWKPEFSSAVILELHHINDEHTIRAFHLERSGKPANIINITDCGKPCTFGNFSHYLHSFIPRNWENACSE